MKLKKAGPMSSRGLQGAGVKITSHLFFSIASGGAAFFAVLCTFAIILCKVDLPVNLLTPIASAGACTGVLAAAFTMARLSKQRGLLYGIGMGAALFFLLWLAAALQGSAILTELAALKALAMVLSGAVGGYWGGASAARKQKQARRH